MRLSKLRFCRAPVLAAGLLAGGCGGSEPVPVAQTPPADAKRVDPATAGHVSGRVTFDGAAPGNAPVKLDSDPACAREHPNGLTLDTILVSNGGLENVFVYVKDGLGNYYFDMPTTPVTLDQKGCNYTPHVIGARTGQPIEIVNSDATLHNVNAVATVNQGFNLGQPIQGMKNAKVFTAPEVMVRIKCDVHSWMTAYAGILPHPYFAVTANGGAFELKGLPPGTYTIEAWHEKLGTQTQSVTLGDKETKSVSFAFKATTP
jgi:Carboxypeptidase regulatory-like domain